MVVIRRSICRTVNLRRAGCDPCPGLPAETVDFAEKRVVAGEPWYDGVLEKTVVMWLAVNQRGAGMNYLIALLMFPIAEYTPSQVMEQGTRHVVMMKMEPVAVAECMQKNASKTGGDLFLNTEVMERYPGTLKVVVSPASNRHAAVAVTQITPVPGGSQAYMWVTPNSYRSPADFADSIWGGCGITTASTKP